MADSYVDRSEIFITNPEKSHITSDKTSTESSENKSSVDPDPPASPVRVSSASWEVKKTTPIPSSTTTEVTHQPRSVSTAEFHIGDRKKSQTDKHNNKNIAGNTGEQSNAFVDRVETLLEDTGVNVSLSTSESSFENISISEAKESASLVDVSGTPLSDENKVYRKSDSRDSSVFSPSYGSTDSTRVTPAVSEDLRTKKDSNETSIQRITHTPGLSIRDFALQEIKDKQQTHSEVPGNPLTSPEAVADLDIGRSLSSLQASSMSWSRTHEDDDILVSEQDLVQPPMVGELLHLSICKGGAAEQQKFPVTISPEGQLDSPVFCSSEEDKHVEMIDQLSVSEVLDMLDEAAGNEIVSLKDTQESERKELVNHQQTSTSESVENLQDTSLPERKILCIQETAETHDMPTRLITSMSSKVNENLERDEVEVQLGHQQNPEQSVEGLQQAVVDVRSQTTQVKTVFSQSKREEESIEIERKFNINSHTEKKLMDIGATLVKTTSFTDVYYDNLDYTLTLGNCWLRRRESEWQLKECLIENQADSSTTQFVETTKETDIINTLLQRLNLKLPSATAAVVDVIEAAALTEFASFTTTRKTYKLPECSVDLDITDSGFMVGEIEVMTSADKISSALRTIEETAKKLDISLLRLM